MGKGDFERSETFYEECLSLSENVGAGLLIALCSGNLGDIHRTRGDLDKALGNYQRSMDINKEMGRTKGYLTGLANCGLVQYARGHSKEALTLLEESLTLSEEQEQARLLGGWIRSFIILSIISILIESGMVTEAQERLERVRQISEESGDALDEHAYRMAAALVLKSSMLPRNREKAKELLIEVVDGRFFDYEISALALLHLAELLVNELQMTGDEDVLQNLEVYLRRIREMATDQGSTLLTVETMLLQSKVALLQLESDEAIRLLNHAESLASQKGVQRTLKRIVEEQALLLDELSIWQELGEDKPPMTSRAEKSRIQEQIGGMIQQGLWRKMLF
jgi:tetratricopeptide (TPR) repeat protein